LGETHCQDHVDHTWHAIGSTWRNSECQDCSCGRCCDGFARPVNIPDDCTMEFDKKECEYKVFKKNDPTQSCPVHGWVGG
ncbi:beta-microseminoprotein-like, partial [Conger conger]|uniref:beta-microseminoprotein-like n=1 Tax=Conger conger TaxID=82655 RepID=UPI002A59BB0A